MENIDPKNKYKIKYTELLWVTQYSRTFYEGSTTVFILRTTVLNCTVTNMKT